MAEDIISLNPDELLEFLIANILARKNVLIVGPPGCGKTDVVGQSVQTVGCGLTKMYPVVSNPTDVRGVGVPSADRTHVLWLPPVEMYVIRDAVERHVVFLDDLGMAPEAVQCAFIQPILTNRIGSFDVGPGVVWIAATNDRGQMSGVRGLIEPLKGRMTIVRMVQDWECWKRWAYAHDVPDELIAFAQWMEQDPATSLINGFKPTPDLTNSPTARNLAEAGEQLKLFGKGNDKLLFAGMAGRIGQGKATAFQGFRPTWKAMEEIVPAILYDPMSAPLPQGNKAPQQTFAVLGRLVRIASNGNMENICKYTERLGQEYRAVFLNDPMLAKKPAAQTLAFQELRAQNQELWRA